ncbi:MAG: hypothetical protein F6K11_26215 [Leptolyngbya sp. SIO3F4]|nr:hypothetical protein [Leptolyngbya sp. SIO3F4]
MAIRYLILTSLGLPKRVLQYAWTKGCYKVMLLIGRKDEGTYKFYESAGCDRYAKQTFQIKSTEAEV